jgi:hypothetical protein
VVLVDESEIYKTPMFARKRAAADGGEYFVEEAEGKDLAYIVEHSCIHCNRLLGPQEVKILPPSYVQDRDPYVNCGLVKRRLMCVGCYNILRSSSRTRAKYASPNAVASGRMSLLESMTGRVHA